MVLSKTTKILLITLLAIILIGGIFLIVRNTKRDTNSEDNGDDNSITSQSDSESDLEETPTKRPTNQDLTDLDTSNWKTYINDNINIYFKYPGYLGGVQANLFGPANNTKESSPYISGEKIVISFDNLKNIYITAYSPDYQEFMDDSFTGLTPIDSLCEKKRQYDDYGNVCDIVYIDNHQVILKNYLLTAEGSSVMNTKALLNNPTNSVYKGLVFSVLLSDVNQKLSSVNKANLKEESSRQSRNIINKNLDGDDGEILSIFFGILNSLKFSQ